MSAFQGSLDVLSDFWKWIFASRPRASLLFPLVIVAGTSLSMWDPMVQEMLLIGSFFLALPFTLAHSDYSQGVVQPNDEPLLIVTAVLLWATTAGVLYEEWSLFCFLTMAGMLLLGLGYKHRVERLPPPVLGVTVWLLIMLVPITYMPLLGGTAILAVVSAVTISKKANMTTPYRYLLPVLTTVASVKLAHVVHDMGYQLGIGICLVTMMIMARLTLQLIPPAPKSVPP